MRETAMAEPVSITTSTDVPKQERDRLTADLGRKNAMLLWNHGTLSVGHMLDRNDRSYRN
jgi:hypothetical protein